MMPGVIMENGERHGSHTNHDRDPLPNGINGAVRTEDKPQDKGKGRAEPLQNVTPTSPTVSNGLNGSFGSIPNLAQHLDSGRAQVPSDLQDRMNQLPPEIAHITHGYMPLSMLLKRLAEKTHNGLTNKILELAQMPVPTSALNVGPSGMTEVDDFSPENLAKNKALLDFAQSTHADWVKALVITNWSRRSEDVSKTIDLKVYMDQQKSLYDMAIHEMAELKRGLAQARLPNPDLKTALQVLSTGKAPWMPELNFIQPPPLTPQDLLKTLENLNTLLSIRLNLQEYDNIPLQFRNYSVKSGRVTFRVAGEFEIDLTIADDNPETQFWFIDFRFGFLPSIQDIPPRLRYHIENRVNSVLLADGLPGCYKLLHEMVLTHKISEFRKQAFELARGKWIDGLKVESLNRSLSIQYWLDRYTKTGPKSWILLGVHSGRRTDGRSDPKATSHLFVRWFRDGKEVKDTEVPFDSSNISVESLLKTVIAKHVKYILETTHTQLEARSLFADGEASLSLSTSLDEPSESELTVQLTSREYLTVSVEPISGRFIFSPASILNTNMEYQFNNKSKDPARDAQGWIETIRYRTVDHEITSHALSVGWMRFNMHGVTEDILKAVFPKGTSQLVWFRRPSWKKDWYMVVSISMSGERWWLIEASPGPTGLKIVSSFQMPIKANMATPTYRFMSNLNVFAAALLSHYTNLKALHMTGSRHKLKNTRPGLPFKVPAIYLRLSDILPSKNKSPRTGTAWANNVIKLAFIGLESKPSTSSVPSPVPDTPAPNQARPRMPEEKTVMVTEARIIVLEREALSILQENFDRDIAFDKKTGSFAIRIRSIVGEPVITPLIESFNRVEQFVDFINVLDKHKDSLHSETPSLNQLVFAYGPLAATVANTVDHLRPYRATIRFGFPDNLMTLAFDQMNPHLRIADHLARVLNEKQGLDGVATLLPLTLPALRALDSIEEAWTPLSERGEALIFVRAVEWYILRYDLFSPSSDGNTPPSIRKVLFEIKMQYRKGEPWWSIRRTDNKEKDEIDAALKSIWDSAGKGWQGMRVSAVAEPRGAEELFGKIDGVIRTVDLSKPIQPPPTQAAPVAPMQQAPPKAMNRPQNQQQRQQPTPTPSQSQSQSQNQGRNNMKREIVEID